MHAFIFNIQRFSIHDGPGIRTTIFFQGCPLQCIWCHNPEGIPHKPEGGENYTVKKFTVDELYEEILKDKIFFEESGGGVTFSGGEPLMQTEFLIDILTRLRKENIHTAIDTSGYAPNEIFREVAALTDLILFDMKIINPERHKHFTGIDNDLIRQNLAHAIVCPTAFRVRIPLVNGITATDENIKNIAEMLDGLENIDIDLLSYHDLGKGKLIKLGKRQSETNLSAPDEKRIKEISDFFKSFNFNVSQGG